MCLAQHRGDLRFAPHALMRGLLITAIVSLSLVGSWLFSRSQEKGENYITLRAKTLAQTTGKDPCELLAEWMAVAKESDNTLEIRAIQQAQKFMGCRNIQKRSQGGERPMSWYTAHTIMLVRFKDERQDKYPVWENVILLEAQSDEEAMAKVAVRAKLDEGDSQGTFTWEGRPARWCFAGVRKLVACVDADERPRDGTEVTYLEMEIENDADFKKFMSGEAVVVRYA